MKMYMCSNKPLYCSSFFSNLKINPLTPRVSYGDILSGTFESVDEILWCDHSNETSFNWVIPENIHTLPRAASSSRPPLALGNSKILNPPLPSEFQTVLPPMPSEFRIHSTPPLGIAAFYFQLI